MRKKVILLFLLVFSFYLTACEFTYDSFNNDTKIMLEVFDDVIDAIDNNDTDYLYSLFSKNTQGEVEDLFDDCILALEYYHGEFVSIKNFSSLGVTNDKHFDLETKEYVQTREITTTTSIFYISIKYFAIHSLDEDAVGIVSFYILEHDDTKDVQFTGSRLWTTGINIGISSEGI